MEEAVKKHLRLLFDCAEYCEVSELLPLTQAIIEFSERLVMRLL